MQVTETSSPLEIYHAAEGNLKKVSKEVLMAACKRLELPTSVTKGLLRQRLKAFFSGATQQVQLLLAPEASVSSASVSVAWARSVYEAAKLSLDSVGKDTLTAACKAAGVSTSLNKDELLQNLRERLKSSTGGGGGGGAGGGCGGGESGASAVPDERAPADKLSPSSSAPCPTLRKSVTHRKDEVFALRADVDLFTLLGKEAVLEYGACVDHVIEIQVLDGYYTAALGDAGVAARTRAARSHYEDLANHLFNLNVTTSAVNQAKKGPFDAFLNRLRDGDGTVAWAEGETCIEDLARNSTSANVRSLVYNGTWARIEKAVVAAHDDLVTVAETQPELHNEHGKAFLSGLQSAVAAMKLDA